MRKPVFNNDYKEHPNQIRSLSTQTLQFLKNLHLVLDQPRNCFLILRNPFSHRIPQDLDFFQIVRDSCQERLTFVTLGLTLNELVCHPLEVVQEKYGTVSGRCMFVILKIHLSNLNKQYALFECGLSEIDKYTILSFHF